MHRVKSINKIVVFYVFVIMIFAGVLTSFLFFLFYVFGIFPFFVLTPVFSPLIALLISSAIGTSISAMASERILKPLNQLVTATKKISTGDFSVRVAEINDNSEIANLLRGFNHMAEELSGIEMFRNNFINDFSHEFKTPIGSIRGFARQLQNENLSPEKRTEYTDIIIKESERLTNMASNILLLNNLDNQQIITDKIEYELDEQIRNCVILLEKDWSRRNLKIDLHLDTVKIFGNEEMLSHLWINLIDNAIKYAHDNGRISITCEKTLSDIRVAITDNGKGMDNTELKHIFDKFYQGDTSHASQGNGLGLSIVKRIVDLYNGKISVESSPGYGATFTVYLPAGSSEQMKKRRAEPR